MGRIRVSDIDLNDNQINNDSGDGNVDIQLGDAAGANRLILLDSGSAEVFGVNSDGEVTDATINSFTNSVDADSIHEQVRNESGGTLTAGTPVYASGYSVGQDLVLVTDADASTSATMPVLGVVETDLANNATGAIVEHGTLKNIDTSAFSVGDVVYVSETAGALTATKPTGAALVEEVGEVVRSHATLGILEVTINPVPYITGLAATLLDDGTQTAMQTTVGVLIGTDVQAYAAPLDSVTGTNTGDEAAASTTVAGVVELATIAETDTGTDATRAVTPDSLQGSALQTKVDAISGTNTGDEVAASTTVSGTVELLTTAELDTGTDTTRAATAAAIEASARSVKLDNIANGVNSQSGTTYTLVIGDAGKVVEMNNAAANVLSVPLNSSVAFSVGTRIDIVQTGAGTTSIDPLSTVTVNGVSTTIAMTGTQYTAVTIYQRATDVWIMVGALA